MVKRYTRPVGKGGFAINQQERLERIRKISQFLFGAQQEGTPALDARDEELAMLQAEICENLYLLTGEKAGMTVTREINYFLNYAKLTYLEAGFRVGALLMKKSRAEVDALFQMAESALRDGSYRQSQQDSILKPSPNSPCG